MKGFKSKIYSDFFEVSTVDFVFKGQKLIGG